MMPGEKPEIKMCLSMSGGQAAGSAHIGDGNAVTVVIWL